MIDTVLTEVLCPMLTSAKSATACGDGDDISVRKKRHGTPEPEIQWAVDDYRCMEGLIQDVNLR